MVELAGVCWRCRWVGVYLAGWLAGGQAGGWAGFLFGLPGWRFSAHDRGGCHVSKLLSKLLHVPCLPACLLATAGLSVRRRCVRKRTASVCCRVWRRG